MTRRGVFIGSAGEQGFRAHGSPESGARRCWVGHAGESDSGVAPNLYPSDSSHRLRHADVVSDVRSHCQSLTMSHGARATAHDLTLKPPGQSFLTPPIAPPGPQNCAPEHHAHARGPTWNGSNLRVVGGREWSALSWCSRIIRERMGAIHPRHEPSNGRA